MSTAIARNLQVGTSGTATDNFTIFQPATPDGTLRIGNGNTGITTSLLTLNSSGNLGLGVTPSAWNTYVAFQVRNACFWGDDQTFASIGSNYYFSGGAYRYIRSAFASADYYQSFGSHIWRTAPSGTAGNAISFTQALTLDASGNLLVGQTSTGLVSSNSAAIWNDGNGRVVTINHAGSPGGSRFMQFGYSGTQIGSITVASSSSVAYNTTSDYRLKENVQPMTGGLAKVAALKPCTYKWKSDGSDGQGFIAHELAEVVPQCVTGAKDAVDDKGNPVYQGIDTSFLVATLTAAIQELKAEFDAYKATHP